MKKIALITGISGQDGAYLSEFLISKNYKVIGTVKNKSKKYLWRIDKLGIRKKLIILKLNICDEVAIRKILNKYKSMSSTIWQHNHMSVNHSITRLKLLR